MNLNKSGLGKEYRISLKLLNERIRELKQIKDEIKNIYKNNYNGYVETGEYASINRRLAPLILMQRDLSGVTREVENYYESGWWRQSVYTMNKREPAQERYVNPVYDM